MRNVIRIAQAAKNTGRGKSTIYRDAALGLFPKPIALGKRCSGYYADELDRMTAARAAGKSEDEIRALVAKIESERRRGA